MPEMEESKEDSFYELLSDDNDNVSKVKQS